MRCELSIFIVNMLRYISLKDKKGNTITNAFQKNWNKSNCKPNKVWGDNKNSDF